MLVEYDDDDLRRLAEDATFRVKRWGPVLVAAYRKKVQVLRAAKDERELGAMRSLNLEKLKRERAGDYSVRLNDQYRLILKFRSRAGARVAVVREITDYH